MNYYYNLSSSSTPNVHSNRSSVSPVDFTKIENLIAKSDQQQSQHQNAWPNWNAGLQYYMFPYYHVVPLYYSLYNPYYQPFPTLYLNPPYTVPTVSSPPAQSQTSNSIEKIQTKSKIGKHGCRVFKPEELDILLKQFKKNCYITPSKTEKLAKKVNKTPTQVRSWFRILRQKLHREQREAEEANEKEEDMIVGTCVTPDDYIYAQLKKCNSIENHLD